MILYEHPLNERVRSYLRLEDLFERLGQLLARDSALDHHFAFSTLFDILELTQRADLKSDVLKDLEKIKQQMLSFRGNPSISADILEEIIHQIEAAFSAVNSHSGKPGSSLQDNEWVMAVRSRMAILAGTCEFDIPAYYHWQHEDAAHRRADLMRWASPLWPLAQAVKLVLKLLRDNGSAQRVMATAGQFQLNLPQGRSVQLVRLRINPELKLVPEISGNRMIVSVRLLRVTRDDKMPLSCSEDASFDLTLCS